MTSAWPPTTVAPPQSRELPKTLRERAAESFHAALGAVLVAGLQDALDAGDHAEVIRFINRGFAEGSPRLGCDLFSLAIAVVGPARTWTVQLAPLTRVDQRPASQGDHRRGATP